MSSKKMFFLPKYCLRLCYVTEHTYLVGGPLYTPPSESLYSVGSQATTRIIVTKPSPTPSLPLAPARLEHNSAKGTVTDFQLRFIKSSDLLHFASPHIKLCLLTSKRTNSTTATHLEFALLLGGVPLSLTAAPTLLPLRCCPWLCLSVTGRANSCGRSFTSRSARPRHRKCSSSGSRCGPSSGGCHTLVFPIKMYPNLPLHHT